MFTETIERDFREKVCSELRLMSEGVERFRVFTPFLFDDGDHLAIALKKENGNWILSDEGHTYMHLTYDLDAADLQRGTRQKIITNALSVFGVQDRPASLSEACLHVLLNLSFRETCHRTDVPTYVVRLYRRARTWDPRRQLLFSTALRLLPPPLDAAPARSTPRS